MQRVAALLPLPLAYSRARPNLLVRCLVLEIHRLCYNAMLAEGVVE